MSLQCDLVKNKYIKILNHWSKFKKTSYWKKYVIISREKKNPQS